MDGEVIMNFTIKVQDRFGNTLKGGFSVSPLHPDQPDIYSEFVPGQYTGIGKNSVAILKNVLELAYAGHIAIENIEEKLKRSEILVITQSSSGEWGGKRRGAGRLPVHFRIPNLSPNIARWFHSLAESERTTFLIQAYEKQAEIKETL